MEGELTFLQVDSKESQYMQIFYELSNENLLEVTHERKSSQIAVQRNDNANILKSGGEDEVSDFKRAWKAVSDDLKASDLETSSPLKNHPAVALVT